jgi:hypothetical protein
MRIQTELKAPKSQFNSFGKYKYRSCEDILEGVKPLLRDYECVITVADEMVLIGERYYVKATATIHDCISGESFFNTALAREEEKKAGMDTSQVTGATSSYARKYALNGLLAIDDTKDSDATNTHGKEPKIDPQADVPESERIDEKKTIDAVKAKSIKAKAEKLNSDVAKLCERYNIKGLDELNIEQFTECIDVMDKTSSISKLIVETKTDIKEFLKFYNVNGIYDMTKEQLEKAEKVLQKKAAKK